MFLRRMQFGFLTCRDEFRARAEHIDLQPLGHVPQPVDARVSGTAFVEHDRRSGADAADQPVPHHPAAGGEVEDPLAAPQIAVQHQLLHVLDEGAAVAVDDALRHAGRAGRIHDEERVVEGNLLKRQLGRRRIGRPEIVSPVRRVANE